jgi:hypothetical protein
MCHWKIHNFLNIAVTVLSYSTTVWLKELAKAAKNHSIAGSQAEILIWFLPNTNSHFAFDHICLPISELTDLVRIMLDVSWYDVADV